MKFNEEQVLSEISSIFSPLNQKNPRVIVGIGDDAAVVSTDQHSVITTDMAIEDIHFNRGWSSAYEIGSKITVANLADVYAMGADPRYLVVALTLTGNEDMNWIKGLAQGIADTAAKSDAVVVGGDLSRADKVMISMTAIGASRLHITRAGARGGDSIYLSALPGWSRAGLEILTKNLPESPAYARALSQFKSPHLDPTVMRSFKSAHALCDVSDSLLVQAEQISKASSVGLEIDTKKIEKSDGFADLAALAQTIGCDVWDLVLGGGEDHVLLATGVNLPGIYIGRVIEGSGVKVLDMKKAPDSWRHFN
jgi:thiamine-monophosphate kinase|uniref:thiamine-phosphate kinase n=1 Tax=Candidatus Planktophila sp. TaxID=2175601 RepID=UPI00404A7785